MLISTAAPNKREMRKRVFKYFDVKLSLENFNLKKARRHFSSEMFCSNKLLFRVSRLCFEKKFDSFKGVTFRISRIKFHNAIQFQISTVTPVFFFKINF